MNPDFEEKADAALGIIFGSSKEVQIGNTYKSIAFGNLEAGRDYVLLAVKDRNASDLLGAGNLLYITQDTADNSGRLLFNYACPSVYDVKSELYGPDCYMEVKDDDIGNPDEGNDTDDNSKDIRECNIFLSKSEYVYNGEPKTPGVKVEDGFSTLICDKDYQISYENNVNAGIASVSIVGIGNYTGEETIGFAINNVSSMSIKDRENSTNQGIPTA